MGPPFAFVVYANSDRISSTFSSAGSPAQAIPAVHAIAAATSAVLPAFMPTPW